MNEQQLFHCPVCSLHYRDEETAKMCEKFCTENNACDMRLAKQAIEYSHAEGESVDES